KLREEKAFDSIDELVKEIRNDVQLTREYFQT
ncbi:MAG: riboflavin kinase, partial [Candidatus Cloacimonetes bacterium]|nr:riboflavin kinase [Candidatus Cloacimonadota bacterium]